MIQVVIREINRRLDDMGTFKKLHCLTELIISQNGDQQKQTPAEYQSKGHYEQITLTKNDGEIWHRKNGSASITNGEKITACGDVKIRTQPMLLIGFARKDILESDDAYIAERLCDNIEVEMSFVNDDIINDELNSISNSVNVTGRDTDHARILRQEWPQSKYTDLNYNFLLFEIQYDIVIEVSQECFQEWCKYKPAYA